MEAEFTSGTTGNDIGEKALGSVELRGGEMVTIGDFEGVVGDGSLELREEQVQWVGKKGIGEENQVLSAMALIGGGVDFG